MKISTLLILAMLVPPTGFAEEPAKTDKSESMTIEEKAFIASLVAVPATSAVKAAVFLHGEKVLIDNSWEIGAGTIYHNGFLGTSGPYYKGYGYAILDTPSARQKLAIHMRQLDTHYGSLNKISNTAMGLSFAAMIISGGLVIYKQNKSSAAQEAKKVSLKKFDDSKVVSDSASAEKIEAAPMAVEIPLPNAAPVIAHDVSLEE